MNIEGNVFYLAAPCGIQHERKKDGHPMPAGLQEESKESAYLTHGSNESKYWPLAIWSGQLYSVSRVWNSY